MPLWYRRLQGVKSNVKCGKDNKGTEFRKTEDQKMTIDIAFNF